MKHFLWVWDMEKIIDKYLEEIISKDLNKLPGKIEKEMVDPNQDNNKEWKKWLPIPSTVTETDLVEYENKIGYKLPDSYKRFLKHNHFYELWIAECSFFSHPIHSWKSELYKMIFKGFPKEFLIDKGRIPFADWSDWGMLCFDTTAECENHDYPIFLWDHEISDEFEPKYQNFESMIIELDKEAQAQNDEDF